MIEYLLGMEADIAVPRRVSASPAAQPLRASGVRRIIVLTNIFGMFSVGKASIVAQHERIFSMIYKSSTDRPADRIHHIGQAEFAVVDVLWVLTGGSKPAVGVQLIDGAIDYRLRCNKFWFGGRIASAAPSRA